MNNPDQETSYRVGEGALAKKTAIDWSRILGWGAMTAAGWLLWQAVSSTKGQIQVWRCGYCGGVIPGHPQHCPHCGTAIGWPNPGLAGPLPERGTADLNFPRVLVGLLVLAFLARVSVIYLRAYSGFEDASACRFLEWFIAFGAGLLWGRARGSTAPTLHPEKSAKTEEHYQLGHDGEDAEQDLNHPITPTSRREEKRE